jgi:NADH:ubiquinone oxidoreductase subunit 6 (subunit J)
VSRNAVMLLGFFLTIAGMFAFIAAPKLGMLLVWSGAVMAWFGMAVAIEKKPWIPQGKLLLQILLGASAFSLALTASPLSIRGIFIAALLGGVIGAFASQWSRWLANKR